VAKEKHEIQVIERSVAELTSREKTGCPECGSPYLTVFMTKTTYGKQGMKFRDYCVCHECFLVWQWVLKSELFGSSNNADNSDDFPL